METAPRTFSSVEDECRYWKERAKQYYKEWTDVKQEYDEYVEQSRQMEAEMDVTLDQKQTIIKDLRVRVASLENDNETLKNKFESQCTELTNVEKQLSSLKAERETMRNTVRQLEQKNDDLERAHRILNESIADVSRMLDKAYEKNAILEMEVDEKEVLQEKLQRLMDETRDLKQEITVKSRHHQTNGDANSTSTTTTTNGIALNADKLNETTTPEDSSPANSPALTDNKRHHQRNFHRNSVSSNLNDYNQQTLKNPDNLINGNAMTASSRTNALNIVAEMLRKLNLDKAFLCPECDRFRCVCERPPLSLPLSPSPTPSPTSPCPTNSNISAADSSSIKRFSRSISNTFGGSKDSVYTNTTPSTPTRTPTGTDIALATADEPEDRPKTLNRNSNHSNSSNSNILRRLADRISGNSNSNSNTKTLTKTCTNHTNTTDPLNSTSDDVILTHSIATEK